MRFALPLSALLSLILSGAIFGFFYAWVCSTMWGLDAADPRVAIKAMQAMNASVRNGVFAPAFFATPFVMLLTAALARAQQRNAAAWAFTIGGVIYLFGGLVLTMAVNVPMNEALAEVSAPDQRDVATRIWADYSPRWQMWNQIRTVLSGVALTLTGVGLYNLRG